MERRRCGIEFHAVSRVAFCLVSEVPWCDMVVADVVRVQVACRKSGKRSQAALPQLSYCGCRRYMLRSEAERGYNRNTMRMT